MRPIPSRLIAQTIDAKTMIGLVRAIRRARRKEKKIEKKKADRPSLPCRTGLGFMS